MQTKNGFSLLETLMVIAIGSFIILILFSLFSIYGRVYNTSKAINRINVSATTGLERMIREIKLANSVDVGLSIFNVHPGNLVLNTTSNSTPVVIEFFLDDTTLKMKQDSVVIGALTKSNVIVERLIFSFSNNDTSQLVTVEMEVSTQNSTSTRTELFLTSGVLRGAY